MTYADYATLNGMSSFRKDFLSENILYGVLDFFDWGTVNIGGFTNVTHSPAISGVYGGDKSRLRAVEDPRYTNGQVWEAFHGNFVWESGVEFGTQPINISGVYIGSTFYPVGTTGDYAFYVDYPRGRVVFDTAIATTGVVKLDYSFKNVNYIAADDHPYVREIMFDYHRVDLSDFLTSGSGNYSQLQDTRVELPLVAVDLGIRRHTPIEIGGGQYVLQDCVFYILAESATDKNILTDIIAGQNDKTIKLLDRAAMKEHANYPHNINYRGELISGAQQYPDLVESFNWGKASFSNTRVVDMGQVDVTRSVESFVNPKLYRSIVHTTMIVPTWNI